MTVAINGTSHHVTPGDELQGCVRAPETAAEAVNRRDAAGNPTRASATRTRAISPTDGDRLAESTPKVRNFASPHVGEVRAAVRSSWPLTESPQPIAVVARQVFPAKGETRNAVAWGAATVAGVFRLAVYALAQLVQLAVATRLRAGVALVLLILAVAAGCVSH